MIFTQVRFLALFVGCWVTFFAVPHAWRSAALAAWGLLFYAIYAGWFVLATVALTLLVLFSDRRSAAWFAGAVTVALLAFFKSTALPEAIPVGVVRPARLLIPLGFSFLAFELLHVVFERRRGRIARLTASDLLAFAFFMPARVAGPIKRYPEFIEQVRSAEMSLENVYAGGVRILLGLAKKLAVADVLALTVSNWYLAASAARVWVIVLAYTFEIYLDFSAYSDIAIGFGRTLGIRLPENFAAPYLAPTIREFWNRWHMTLSFWVRDYIFIPTGRELFHTTLRSRPLAVATISFMLTFLAVGAWHGLTGAFLVWGAYHGLLLSAHQAIRSRLPARIGQHPWYHSRPAYALSVAVTFFFVSVGWVPFMSNLSDAGRLLSIMFGVR